LKQYFFRKQYCRIKIKCFSLRRVSGKNADVLKKIQTEKNMFCRIIQPDGYRGPD
jgi:hypothetical protein